jgi:hypothetical protein
MGSVCFPLAVVGIVKGLHPRCTGHPHSLEYAIAAALFGYFFTTRNPDILLCFSAPSLFI